MPAFILLLQLTLEEVIANLPRDAGAVVTFLLLGLFVGFVWLGSRPKKGKRREPGATVQPPAPRSRVPDSKSRA